MDNIKDLIPKMLKKRGLQDHANASLIIFQTKTWLVENLPDFHSFLTPMCVKDSVLIISCDNSVAAQECQQVHSQLLAHLLGECGHTEIQSIRLIRKC